MAGRKPREQDPGPGETPQGPEARERASSSYSSGPRGGGWREELERVATRLLDQEELGRLRKRLGDAGRVGDLVVAAHLDDALFVERARLHRARRELGRALATDDKELVAVSRQRLLSAVESVSLTRLQRDLATGEVTVDLGERQQGAEAD